MKHDLAIVGTKGVPGRYGGFETLADNLVRKSSLKSIAVYAEADGKRWFTKRGWMNATVYEVPFKANGWQSVIYDYLSIIHALFLSKNILILGVSGCSLLPFIRILVHRKSIVVNVDGIEWQREKWGRVARGFLRFSEWCAVRFASEVIADNQGIQDYLADEYNCSSVQIAYGGDFPPIAVEGSSSTKIGECRLKKSELPIKPGYYLALCRIEPENHVEMILEAFTGLGDQRLVFVGNWAGSKFGQTLRAKYKGIKNLQLLDPIYDPDLLVELRENAVAYIHGHGAGGTNPSLVEALTANLTALAFDVVYNRFTTGGMAYFWRDSSSLKNLVNTLTVEDLNATRDRSVAFARERYSWPAIVKAYDEVFRRASR